MNTVHRGTKRYLITGHLSNIDIPEHHVVLQVFTCKQSNEKTIHYVFKFQLLKKKKKKSIIAFFNWFLLTVGTTNTVSHIDETREVQFTMSKNYFKISYRHLIK